MTKTSKKRGRPPSANSFLSAATNYEALASQVIQRKEKAKKEGRNLTTRAAVKAEMDESVKRCNKKPGEYPDTNGEGVTLIIGEVDAITHEALVDVRIDTTYTKVRKILKDWKAQGK